MEVSIAKGFCQIKTHIITTSMNHHLVLIHIQCKASNISSTKSPKIMIISQPNSSDLGACMISDPSLVEIADSLHCDVIAYDYSGYGCSTGHPSQEAIYSDIEAVHSFVTTQLQYTDGNILLFGFSMGTAASIHLASIQQNLCGMILVAPFTSLLR
uniref:Serine aminopeptidase S33 domain-containing protein n=1 Tax=Panagrolaimus sp. ES5 TaxID=591445 RepID=A0AC34GE45_9BILA